MDSVPMVSITGQVGTPLLGTDAFQELDVFGLTMPIVKHSWLVRSVDDLPARGRRCVPDRPRGPSRSGVDRPAQGCAAGRCQPSAGPCAQQRRTAAGAGRGRHRRGHRRAGGGRAGGLRRWRHRPG
ncbi:hypothetical protein [Stenotrophomonas sp. S11A1a]|uniref:hypothetical protein n=1 Tax=Stenotrophomonas sp. S11A1a TaxID=3455011 RepID=UPI003F7AB826